MVDANKGKGMRHWVESPVFGNPSLKRRINQWYLFLVNTLNLVLHVMPGCVRGLCFRCMLKECRRSVFIGSGVYIKFPRPVEMGDHVSGKRGVEFYSGYLGRHKIVLGWNEGTVR